MRKIIAAVFVISSLMACKKESTSSNNNDSTPKVKVYLRTVRHLFTPSDTTQSPSFFEFISATANVDSNNRVDMGIVQYSDSILAKDSVRPNYIAYRSSYQNPDLYNGWSSFLNGGKVWTVSGNSTTGIPNFTATTSPTYPSLINSTFPRKIFLNKIVPFKVSWNNSVPGDSVDVRIYGNVAVVKSNVLPGNASSYTFNPSQLQVFSAGETINVQIVGRITQSQTVGNVQFNVENAVNKLVFGEIQ